MIVGIPNAGQVNTLATLNIRGERSVTCRGDFDRHPSLGPLPPAAPPVCEYFRDLPDALEQAAALDARYGRVPDLGAMPMYGVVFSFKDSFDTADMRSTGGGDARYDIDFPARDHVLVGQLRKKGAIIFAKAVNTEYNGRAAILAATTGRSRCCLRRLVISAAPGAAIRPTRTTRPVPHRSDRAPALRCP
jgi:amidase